ncbi:hypothetical protein K439DRAFT_1624434 [Ramaria rubella]|nr:hypothetical protein K439DRAFT_1624434 [Ramaria rubella]
MCAIVLDRCLWSLGFEREMIDIQWVHPLSGHLTTVCQTPQKHLDTPLQGFWVSYGAHGSVELGQRGPSDVALNAEVVVCSANHKSTAELHATLGNLYGMAGILISLSVLNKQDHLEKVMQAVLSDSHCPPTFQAKLVDIYGHLWYQDLQSYYYAIVVSILEICSDKFSRKNVVMYNYDMHDMMKAQLSASSRGCVPASTLRAERGIWEHILNIIGSKDSLPLRLPTTFSGIGGKSLQITQGTDSPRGEGSSVSGVNSELQTRKVDLQLMYQHETSENQLDQLATDLGPVNNAVYFVKRQVWSHGGLLPYEVPENVPINLESPALDDVQKKKKRPSSPSKKRKREPSPGSAVTEPAKTKKRTGSQRFATYVREGRRQPERLAILSTNDVENVLPDSSFGT